MLPLTKLFPGDMLIFSGRRVLGQLSIDLIVRISNLNDFRERKSFSTHLVAVVTGDVQRCENALLRSIQKIGTPAVREAGKLVFVFDDVVQMSVPESVFEDRDALVNKIMDHPVVKAGVRKFIRGLRRAFCKALEEEKAVVN